MPVPALDEATSELQDRARRFTDEVLDPARAGGREHDGPLPRRRRRRHARQGVEYRPRRRPVRPRARRAGLVDGASGQLVEEQFGRSTNAISWYMPSAYNVWHRPASDALQDRWLRPGAARRAARRLRRHRGEAGSDPPGSGPPRVRRPDGGYVINGEKWFVTFGDVAAVLIVMANVLDGDQTAAHPVRGPGRRRRASRSSTTRRSPTTTRTVTRRSRFARRRGLRRRRHRRGRRPATTCSAPGSPRSGSASPRAASVPCSGC